MTTPRYQIVHNLAHPFSAYLLVDHQRETAHTLRSFDLDRARDEACREFEISPDQIAMPALPEVLDMNGAKVGAP